MPKPLARDYGVCVGDTGGVGVEVEPGVEAGVLVGAGVEVEDTVGVVLGLGVAVGAGAGVELDPLFPACRASSIFFQKK
jgi:serine acetyltransferase